MTVLVVDDDPSFREAVGELLMARGFEVVGYATNEDEALVAVNQLQPDAVLLDVHLPGPDGFHLAERLAELHPAPTVLLTSTDSEAGSQPLAVGCGAVGFVAKADLASTDLNCYFSS